MEKTSAYKHRNFTFIHLAFLCTQQQITYFLCENACVSIDRLLFPFRPIYLATITMQALASSGAGAYNEFLLKKDINIGINTKNAYMYVFSIIFNLLFIINAKPGLLLSWDAFFLGKTQSRYNEPTNNTPPHNLTTIYIVLLLHTHTLSYTPLPTIHTHTLSHTHTHYHTHYPHTHLSSLCH